MMGPHKYLDEQKVQMIFKDYLNYMKQPYFYMATDDTAIQHIEKEIGIIGLNI